MIKLKILFILVLLVGILFLKLIILEKDRVPRSSDLSQVNVLSDSKPWIQEIKRVGGTEALLEFKKAYGGRPEIHNTLHVFGKLLYEINGLSGFTHCDSDFNYGCYHGFFATALAADGTEIIHKLDDICIKNATSGEEDDCQHGIGHGLMEYFGPKKLSQALDQCGNLKWDGKIFGCPSGVFMEYNFPVLIHGNIISQSTREFEKDNPLKPCQTIKNQFKESCYHELGQYLWWVFHEDYAQIAFVCNLEKSTALRRYCFLGVGYYAPQALAFNPEEVIEACSNMPRNYFVDCIAASSQEMRGNKVAPKDKIAEICRVLSGEELKTCLASEYYAAHHIIFR